MNNDMRLSVLETMCHQLREVIDGLVAVKPPGLSIDSYRKYIREAEMQLDAMTWAHETLKERTIQ